MKHCCKCNGNDCGKDQKKAGIVSDPGSMFASFASFAFRRAVRCPIGENEPQGNAMDNHLAPNQVICKFPVKQRFQKMETAKCRKSIA